MFQEMITRDLPSFARERLTEIVPRKQFLKCLKGFPDVCNSVFQGFEVKPQNLSLPMIRTRALKLFEESPEICRMALDLWAGAGAPVLEEIRGQNVGCVREHVVSLGKKWGGAIVVLALAADERKEVRELVPKGAEALRGIPEPSVVSEKAEPAEVDAASESDRQSDDATPVKREIELLKQQMEEARQSLSQAEQRTRSTECQLAEARARLAGREQELDDIHKQVKKMQKALDRSERARVKAEETRDELKKALSKARAALCSPATSEKAPGPKPAASEFTGEQVRVVCEKFAAPHEQGDEIRFRADGLHHALSIKQIVRDISTNHETNVREYARLVDPLKRTDIDKYRALTAALTGSAGRYFVRVLAERLTPAIVDGSNVAHCERDQRGKAKLRAVLSVREELRSGGFFPIWIYVDASLPYQIDDPAGLARLVQLEEIVMVPAGSSADDAISRHARDTGACVVTNDRHIADAVAPLLRLDTIGFVVFNSDVTLRDL